MQGLESLNTEKFPSLTTSQKMDVRGGTDTAGGTVTYQRVDYKLAYDCTEWVNGKYHFMGYGSDGELALDYWG